MEQLKSIGIISGPYAAWIPDALKEKAEDRLERKTRMCDKCIYVMRIAGGTPGQALCNYLGITGKMRGCSPINCKKFTPGKKEAAGRGREIKVKNYVESDIDMGDWVFDRGLLWDTADGADERKQG